MSIPGSAEPLLLAQQDTGYKIERSLRFNSSDSAYLSRTPASAGNRKTWTWSGWVKRTVVAIDDELFSTDSSDGFVIRFVGSTSVIRIYSYSSGSYQLHLVTTPVYRDPSAWYHLVVSVDTTQATSSDRAKIYVNGTQVTALSTAVYPSQNTDLLANQAIAHFIGKNAWGASGLNACLADIHFIDGQALTPSSFAETNATTGQWVPKAYSGTFTGNSFWLKFADNSAATATTLGKDSSGLGNNWTPNNLSVTAGAGNDSLVDTPTSYGTDTGAGGEVRGNYATLNPLNVTPTYAAASNGNLTYIDTTNAGSYQAMVSTMFATSGKFYFEATVSSVSGTPYPVIGLVSPPTSIDFYIEKTSAGYQGYGYHSDGQKSTNDSYSSFGSSYTSGDTVAVAVDIDAGKVWFSKNGVWQGSGNPTTGANPAFNIVAGRPYGFAVQNGASTTSIQMDCNFGQRQWAYAAPAGFKALCDTNLPAPVVAKPSESFQTVLWTGDNTSNRTITTGLRSGFVWIKNRSATGPTHILHDVVRGAGQTLYTSSGSAEVNNGTAYVQQFNATNFLLGATDSACNASGASYVGWVWDPGANTVTNTQGSITSQVRANASSGFSVVTYSANTSGAGTSATIGHGLGVAPSMIIVKSRNFVDSWYVYHSSVGNTQFLELQSTAAAATFSTMWNNTSPTSTVFSTTYLNQQSRTYVAYCFAPVAGYSSFGSYTGNGSTDGPFVYTGFRPRWVLIRSIAGPRDWLLYDTARGLYNPQAEGALQPNTSGTAYSSGSVGSPYENFDILSNGFKLRNSINNLNTNAEVHIYAAFAENPFQYARAR